MAKLSSKPNIDIKIILELTEEEARALDAIVGYGANSFYDVFIKHMGSAYIEQHKDGVYSLFDSTRAILPNILNRVDNARKEFNK